MTQKKKHCRYCEKEIPWNKVGVYRDYCEYDCYIEGQKANKKITDYF